MAEENKSERQENEKQEAVSDISEGLTQTTPGNQDTDKGHSSSHPNAVTPTVSMLDLMDELGDPDHQDSIEAREQGSDSPDRDGNIPIDNEATPTGRPAPVVLPSAEPVPLPLTAQELTPNQRPPVTDDEATRVQPRSAFPGQTRLHQPIEEEAQRHSDQNVPPDNAQVRSGYPSITESPTQPILRRAPVRAQPSPVAAVQVPAVSRVPLTKGGRSHLGCAGRLVMIAVLVILIATALGIAGVSLGYIVVGSQLPLPSELRARASTFETAQILDRNGRVLYSLADPSTGNRSYVSLDQIDIDLQNATIATEDARFYSNPGFDPLAISRAIFQAAQEGEATSGASTITQQLARALLLDEEERTQRTFSRKVKEIILSAELFRTYPKEEILELYLNEIYYGNRAYGIEAAALAYFGKSASDLSLAEASLLAGLPQAPALWDPFTAPAKALGRQREVLSLMISEGYITTTEAQEAISETTAFIGDLEPPAVTIRHPHFTFTVLQQLEADIGAQAIYRGGLRIYTTLDPAVQQLAEESIAEAREGINAGGANNASMVVLDPQTGEILALVGSADFDDEEIDGQVNMALAPRQPGSAIKPLIYLSALEEGWTPSTLIWDVETAFPDGTNPPYVPKNYDDSFHGPLRLRPALGNSYNIPAVKALEFVGVCSFIERVQMLGLISLQDSGCAESGQPREHGLSLALGGGEISPLEMAGAFGALANGGRFQSPYAIARIEDRSGNLMFEQRLSNSDASQVVLPEHAYLLNDILSDNDARQPEFGLANSLMVQGHRVAAKTGTSGTDRFDVRDGWTVGYTPEVVTAVWVGNTDNSPVGEGQNGYRLASPIWQSFMSRYLLNGQSVDFIRPQGIVEHEICADSGALPGSGCTNRIRELFASDQPPADSNSDFVRSLPIDLWTNLRANEYCDESSYEAAFFNLVANGREDVLVREKGNARKWLEETSSGQAWLNQRGIKNPLQIPPDQACEPNTLRPKVEINQPQSLESVTGEIEIRGTALGPNFTGYEIHYGLSQDPQGWAVVQEHRSHAVDNGLLARWDTAGITAGPVTLRLTILGPDNPYTPETDPVFLEIRHPLTILEPTATPSPTPTNTPTATDTPTPTNTSTSTSTPRATSTVTTTATKQPTVTTVPTVQPSASPTPIPAETPTPNPYPNPGQEG